MNPQRACVLCALLIAIGGGFCSPLAAVAVEPIWRIHPDADNSRRHVSYSPQFSKHFTIDQGVLKGKLGLGDDWYTENKFSRVFQGVGNVWATRSDWDPELADFDVTFDYQWFQAEPMVKFGDFPQMSTGFRLNEKGEGYNLTWGWLGQIRLMRISESETSVIGLGLHRGVKAKWLKVRLRAAGPTLKAKIWPQGNPEPEHWLVEAYDRWPDDKPRYRQGALALGFAGVKLFDTCVYQYKNVSLKKLTAAEVESEKIFDPATAPQGYVKSSSTAPAKLPSELTKVSSQADLESFQADPGIQIIKNSDGGIHIQSRDGKPAFLWKKVPRGTRTVVLRVKGSDKSRPLLAIKGITPEGVPRRGYLDPSWRPGVAAVLSENADHTANASLLNYRPDTWYDLVSNRGHWLKWQIFESGQQKLVASYSAKVFPFDLRKDQRLIGVGVAGSGTVTLAEMYVK